MSGDDTQQAPLPATTTAEEARRQLIAEGFDMLPPDDHRPRTQMWRNRHGKIVYVDFTDETFQHCWTESLRIAVAARDVIPAHPWPSMWEAVLGPKGFKQ
jgi:hypothetical protein